MRPLTMLLDGKVFKLIQTTIIDHTKVMIGILGKNSLKSKEQRQNK